MSAATSAAAYLGTQALAGQPSYTQVTPTPLRPQANYIVKRFSSPQELAAYTRLSAVKQPIIMAHRGGLQPYNGIPESTIAGADIAARTAPCFVEIDVRTTADGELMCVHDAELTRSTSGKGEVKALSASYLRSLTLKDARGELTSYRIPSLDEFLDWGSNGALLWLDLKDAQPQKVVAAIKKHRAEARVIVSAYGAERIKAYASLAPELVYFIPLDTENDLQAALAAGMNAGHIIGFSGFDYPRPEIVKFHATRDIPTLTDIQLDGRLQPYQLARQTYQSVLDRGVPFLNTEHYPYVASLLGLDRWA